MQPPAWLRRAPSAVSDRLLMLRPGRAAKFIRRAPIAVIQIKIRLGIPDNRAYDARSPASESQAPVAERPIALPPASVGAYNVDDDIRDDVSRGHLS
jgi:hypothetical protein